MSAVADQRDSDGGKMPLLDHLVELRSRLLRSVIALLLAFFVCFYFAEDIFYFLAAPLERILAETVERPRMIFTALTEVFFTYVKVAFFTAAMPSHGTGRFEKLSRKRASRTLTSILSACYCSSPFEKSDRISMLRKSPISTARRRRLSFGSTGRALFSNSRNRSGVQPSGIASAKSHLGGKSGGTATMATEAAPESVQRRATASAYAEPDLSLSGHTTT